MEEDKNTREIYMRLVVIHSVVEYYSGLQCPYGTPFLGEASVDFKSSGQWSTQIVELTVSAGQTCIHCTT